MQPSPSKDSWGESLLQYAGLCIHLCVGCDLDMVYVASCGVIVPLMTFAYVFGAGFVQSVSMSLVNGSGNSVDCVGGRTVMASLLVPASYLVGCKSDVSWQGWSA